MARFTGRDYETVRKDMSRNRYFTAQQAVDYGLVDRVLAPDDKQTLELQVSCRWPHSVPPWLMGPLVLRSPARGHGRQLLAFHHGLVDRVLAPTDKLTQGLGHVSVSCCATWESWWC